MSDNQKSNYKWYMLVLMMATSAFVAGLPVSCMPVLFKEISDDLGLSLVQVGSIWGIASLAGIFVSLIAGLLSDRFGVRLIMSLSCLLAGVTGALRGLSYSFLTLAITVFINGILRLIIPIYITKTIGIWFKGRNLGMAMGISAMGMGLGLLLGPMISATVLSPLLGGWRNIMHFYGGLSVVVGVFWLLFSRDPQEDETVRENSNKLPIRQAFLKLIHIKGIWLIGFALLFRSGSIMGLTGYLPLYLRDQGWTPASADGTLAAFYAVSTLCVVPLSSLSDKLGSRKAILIPALVVTIICLCLLPVVKDAPVWILMILSGIFMDGFMAISITMLLETEGIGPELSGTALGIIFTIFQIGSVFSPPIGNSFAYFNTGLPFIFWAILSIAALFILVFIRERK